MRLNDFRINTRIYGGFGSLIVIAAALAVFGIFQLGAIDGHLKKFVGVAGNTARNLTVQRISARMRRLALQYQTAQDPAAARQFAEDDAQAIELLAAATKVTVSEERRRLYADSSAARDKLFTGGDELIAATDKLVAAARAQSETSVRAQAIDLEAAVLKLHIANWRFLATHDPKGPATFKATADKAHEALGTLENSPAAGDLASLIAPVKASLDAYAANFTVVAEALLSSGALYATTMGPKFEKISAAGDAARKTLEADLNAA
jgi:hypothetical protein